MEPGCGSPSVLPHWPQPKRQPALWPTLAALALLSSVAEASLGPAPRIPAPRLGPAPLVRFRFCSGSCRRARSPHDLSLASLLGAGALRPPPGSRPVSQPCCRPTRYEAVSFMDVNSTWRTVDRLSATACGCLG
ncbi:artemin [Eumetopias jubatus]|uniref:artemin n=1 Tax=Eumetopias jubatus TaxID=34886 RepID=UPI00101603BF|nr:artemin [Eumetopias jubatus]